MLKQIFLPKKRLALKARITKIAEKFDGDTQRVRGQLILDLETLLEMVHRKAQHKGATTKNKQKWAQLATYISRALGFIAKEYDAAKIRKQLDELTRMATELERQKGN